MPTLTPGRVSPLRTVPAGIERPEYVGHPRPERYTGPEVKDADTIERMRVAGRIAAQALAEVGRHVAPGVTTDELDRIGHNFLVDQHAYPSTLGYKGFPKSLCTSVNEVVCHGIPDSTELRDGDIVNVDITAYIGGVHGDTDATFLVGERRRGGPAAGGTDRGGAAPGDQGGSAGPADQRDRPGHRVVRATVRLRRRP